MLEEIKNLNATKKNLKNFGLTIGVILLLICGWLLWKANSAYLYFLMIGTILIATAFLVPIILKPLYLVWMTFATILGWIMTRVILTILYYLILTPIGLISKIFGKQFLNLKWNNPKPSYWNYRDKTPYDKENFKKQF